MLAQACLGAPHPHRLTHTYQQHVHERDTHHNDLWLSRDTESNDPNMATLEHIHTPIDTVRPKVNLLRKNWQGDDARRGENASEYERIRESTRGCRALSSISCSSFRSLSDEAFISELHENETEKNHTKTSEETGAGQDQLRLTQCRSSPEAQINTAMAHLSKRFSRTHELDCSSSDTELHRGGSGRRYSMSHSLVGSARVGRANSVKLQRASATGRQPLSSRSRALTASALGESRGCGSPASVRSRASDVDIRHHDWMGNVDDLLLAYVGAGNVTGMALALEKGANADTTDAMGEPIVHLVVRQQNHDMWGLLKCHTASVNATDLYGATALHVAAGLPDSHLLTELLDCDAHVNCEDRFGRTALHVAVSRNLLDNVVVLLNHGADPNRKTKEGRTPLHLSALHSFSDIAQVLVQHGASSSKQDSAGNRPGDLACTPTFMSDAMWSAARAEDADQSLPYQDTLNDLMSKMEELESTCHEQERKIGEMTLRSSLQSSQVVHAMMEAEKAHNMAFGAVVVSATVATVAVVMRILRI